MAARILRNIASAFTHDKTKERDFDPIMEEEFGHVFAKVKNFTMTSKERAYALYKAVKYIVNSGIDGDFVECGVWKGGSGMIMAYALLEMGQTTRRIHLFDTFEGMPKPTKEDYKVSNRSVRAESEWESKQCKNHNQWCFSPLSEVRNNMHSTGYPDAKIIFVKGKVEDTIPENMPDKIALLRLDTDWYESTKYELEHLYPILVEKGVLIIDDYGFWAGAKKATDEFFSKEKGIFLVRIDDTGRIGIKT